MLKVGRGLLGVGDVERHADEADMLTGRAETRLRLGAQPAPLSVPPSEASLQRERLMRRLLLPLLTENPGNVVGVDDVAPVEDQRLLVADADEIHIRLIDELAR